MKKIICLLASVSILSAAAAFGAAGTGTFQNTTWDTPDGAGNLTYSATGVGAGVAFTVKTSANVQVSLNSDGTYYVAGASHTSGSKSYATGSGDSRIYMQEKASTATAFPLPPAINSGSPSWTGWTAVK